MKRNYFGLWILLAVALLVITGVSAFSPISIGDYEVKDSGIVTAIAEHKTDSSSSLNTSGTINESEQSSITDTIQAVKPQPVDTTAKTILFIGDSMLEGLSPRLAAYATHNGHTLYSVIWYSSTSEIWGNSDKLKGYMNRIKPDFVFICLGANELFVKDITAKRDKYVKNIINQIGNTPYLWIGPPNWKPDTGINKLIAANTPAGSFFLSDGMSFERSKDGAHPTRSSAAVWMDSVIRWMPNNVPHPFKLNVPDKTSGSPKRVFVHQPNER